MAAHERQMERYKVQPKNTVADLELAFAGPPCCRLFLFVDLESLTLVNMVRCVDLLAMTWHHQMIAD